MLDLFFTNRPSLIELRTILSEFSDHEIVYVSSHILASNYVRKILQWDKANFNHIIEIILDFSATFMNQFNSETPVNTLWDKFKSLCVATVPFKFSCNKSYPPWLTRQNKRLSMQKQWRYNTARSINLPNDWNKYYDLKKSLQRCCRQSQNSYLSSLLDSNNNVTERFWSFIIKHKRKNKIGINTLHSSGQMYTEDKAKADVLNNHCFYKRKFNRLSLY